MAFVLVSACGFLIFGRQRGEAARIIAVELDELRGVAVGKPGLFVLGSWWTQYHGPILKDRSRLGRRVMVWPHRDG